MKNSLKVIFLIGVSASGKSTWSKKFVETNNNYVRIGRDDFRYMLKNQGVCEQKIETLITDLMNITIINSLNKNLNVIIDNTNLKASYIETIIDIVKYKADIEYKVFDVEIEEAIERDSCRERTVGKEVIKNQYKQYLNLCNTFNFSTRLKQRYTYKEPIFDKNLEDIVVFDLDGTLFHYNDVRSPYSWNEVDKDVVDEVVSEQARNHRKLGHKIFIVSGRDASCKELTEKCLNNSNIPYDGIFMRKENDHRKDTIIKEEIYLNEFKNKYNVKIWYDDRQCVVDKIRSLNIKVFQVNEGNF